MSKLALFLDAVFAGDFVTVTHSLNEDPSLINQQDEDGDSALHRACWAKQLGIIGMLLGHGADVNARGWCGRTPLHYCVHEGRAISVPIVQSLMDQGADPSIKDNNGYTPADWAKVEMEDWLAEVLKMLESPVDRHAQRLKILSTLEQMLKQREKDSD